jgi:hypothetical protein
MRIEAHVKTDCAGSFGGRLSTGWRMFSFLGLEIAKCIFKTRISAGFRFHDPEGDNDSCDNMVIPTAAVFGQYLTRTGYETAISSNC